MEEARVEAHDGGHQKSILIFVYPFDLEGFIAFIHHDCHLLNFSDFFPICHRVLNLHLKNVILEGGELISAPG